MKTLFGILLIVGIMVLLLIVIKEIIEEDILYKCESDTEINLKNDLIEILRYIKDNKVKIPIEEFDLLGSDSEEDERIDEEKDIDQEEVQNNEIQKI